MRAAAAKEAAVTRIVPASVAPLGRGRQVRRRSTKSTASHPSAAATSEVTSRLGGEASDIDPVQARRAASSDARVPSRMAASCREARVSEARVARSRRRSTIGAAHARSVRPSTRMTAPQLLRLQRSRAAARSADETSASTSGLPSGAGITNVYRPEAFGGGAEPPMTARRRTGTIDVETANASPRPGDSGGLPSACSATTVHLSVPGSPGRARSRTGSIRRRRGPSALWATNSAAGPSTRERGRSDTRPAHARGAASAS